MSQKSKYTKKGNLASTNCSEADELFECVWPFYKVGAKRVNKKFRKS